MAATNTKLTGAEFFRKYSDIIKEAEEQVDEAVRVFPGGSDQPAPAKGSRPTADYERTSLASQVKQNRSNNRQADPSRISGTVGPTKGASSSQWARQDQPGTASNNARAFSGQK